jgi:hypothetical protein
MVRHHSETSFRSPSLCSGIRYRVRPLGSVHGFGGSEQQRPGYDVPHSLPQEGGPRCTPSLPTDRRSSPRIWPILVGHAVELATADHLPTTRPSPSRHLRWPSTACAGFERQAPTRADDEPVMDAAGDHADSDHLNRAAACHRRAPRPRGGPTQRTQERRDTGRPHRTPDTGGRPADT